MTAPGEITALLQKADQGDIDASDQLFRLVQDPILKSITSISFANRRLSKLE